MLLVLLGGALVTKTDSGAGCGQSFPLCHGQVIPDELLFETIVELSHRVVSAVAGILVLILSVWSWRAIGHKRETNFLAILAFFFLMLQALLGAGAVVWGHSDVILALHFGISLISFAAVLLLTLLIFEVDRKFNAELIVIDKRMRYHAYGLMTYIFVVVYSGAFVRHTNSSLACPDWPFCVNSQWNTLPLNPSQWFQMGHRMAAAFIFIWICYLAYIAYRDYKHQKVIYYGWMIAFGLVLGQVVTGALVVITRLNLVLALSHALIISLLFGLLSYFLLLMSRAKVNSKKKDE
ncbi:COX15/CtaA family protein [Jeotgalibacillus proteolyticus]|uniref:Heme A synthase n=1 Tax=Jeotgalibacillus proteolyticus TaxID=2082395 RepID=A0A2S5GHF7_9BACL|nr:heme A synthase [Jeotgalibacillus proteolyticus]PPA72490.1 heme A synthase [Jeotgalibacillus proteolyticus]